MDKGVVIRTDAKDAYIVMSSNKSCKTCSSKGMCFANDKPIPFKIKNNYGLEKGDNVEIELSSKTKLSSGFLLFIFPILSLIGGYALAMYIYSAEEAGMIGAVIGVIISIVLLKLINGYIKKRNLFMPKSVKKI